MKILYKITDDAPVMQELEAAGLSRAQVELLLAGHQRAVLDNPANFAYAPGQGAENSVSTVKTGGASKKRSVQARQIKRLFSYAMRVLKAPEQGDTRAEARFRAMAEMNRKMKNIAPMKSEAQQRKLVTAICSLERLDLTRMARRPRKSLERMAATQADQAEQAE